MDCADTDNGCPGGTGGFTSNGGAPTNTGGDQGGGAAGVSNTASGGITTTQVDTIATGGFGASIGVVDASVGDASTGGDAPDASSGGSGGTGGVATGGTGGVATGGTGGVATGGTGGVATGGTGGVATGGTGGVDPVGNKNRAPGFVDLSPPMGDPFPDTGDTTTTTPPAGWVWHNVAGAICRDGSPTGVYIRKGTTDKLVIYLEGGGACSDDHFCAFNPKNVDQVLAGNGQTVIGSTAGAVAGHQQPGVYTDNTGVQGMFDTSNAANPYKDWNMVYVPYCTGDVFFGTAKNATVPGATNPGPQQFVGYDDMKLFIGRIVPTFKDKVSKVVLTGASAGGFGTALNFSMVQDAFGDIPVLAIDDSGPPFDDQYMPVCMQKKWRAQWGFAGSMPPDCTECQQADGGGLVKLADFLLRKHPAARIAIISSMYDEVIRLFYTVGVNNCASYDTADPVSIVLLATPPLFSSTTYHDGLLALRSTYTSTGRFATYFMGSDAAGITSYGAYHQHVFRPEFYKAGGSDTRATDLETPAQFVANFINGTTEQVGPKP
jgi:hypothetical protein